jgi:hypothetical protein
MTSQELPILIAGIVSFLLGVASGILIGSHSYATGVVALVLSVAGWGLTLRLSTRT